MKVVVLEQVFAVDLETFDALLLFCWSLALAAVRAKLSRHFESGAIDERKFQFEVSSRSVSSSFWATPAFETFTDQSYFQGEFKQPRRLQVNI